jgi:ribose transport system substrate-binding protein
MTVQDVSNPVWAAQCSAIQEKVEANGGEMTYVACDSNVTTQIQQIENFIASGVTELIVHPADPAGVESALKAARDEGIKVIGWDDKLENADVSWIIDNTNLGNLIGIEAAKWINEKLGGEAEVAILNYPQLPILLERENGIIEELEKGAPNAKIVAKSSAINVAEGQEKMEAIFAANPNVKVVCCIGGGGAVGANEVAKAQNRITDDFGIFAADATDQELIAIKNNEGNRATIMITGQANDVAEEIYMLLDKLHKGEPMDKEFYRYCFPVTKENVDKYVK